MGIEYEEIAKSLEGDYGGGDWILLRNRLLHKNLQQFAGAADEIGTSLRSYRHERRRIFGRLKMK